MLENLKIEKDWNQKEKRSVHFLDEARIVNDDPI